MMTLEEIAQAASTGVRESTTRAQRAQRLEEIGQLARIGTWTVDDIARRYGLGKEYVRELIRRHHPDAAPARGKLRQRAEIGQLLLDPEQTLSSIARKFGLSRERVRQIQAKHFPESPRPKAVHVPKPKLPGILEIKQELYRILRDSGASWCARCRQALPLDQFAPWVRLHPNQGLYCRSCSSGRLRKYNQQVQAQARKERTI